ncbi:MAG: PaaI family thioesterase [Syntrophales bacterium]
MKQRVVAKQENCAHCMVCGLENEFGLKAAFFELENGEVAALFRPQERHQSYPGRLHGGMAAAILDETIGRAMMLKNRGVWGVTAELSLRYLLPVPLEGELRAVGRITRDTRRLFEGTGEILLPNGDVAVSACGKYLKLPLDKIAGSAQFPWRVRAADDDPAEIAI